MCCRWLQEEEEEEEKGSFARSHRRSQQEDNSGHETDANAKMFPEFLGIQLPAFKRRKSLKCICSFKETSMLLTMDTHNYRRVMIVS